MPPKPADANAAPPVAVGVVDASSEQDLTMVRAFAGEFASCNVALVHLPVILSDVHRKTYFDNVPSSNPFINRLWHWLSGAEDWIRVCVWIHLPLTGVT
ncbi:hypothetical protein HIM_06691 [Hirsutella minnesotensis 3608]|uniref:Uncharacterized protein n=1 Tax=Hirsutella minnesotensis 3608 TaxID=1043627 RepID=A0A0F7ZU05_9HYPO|nr:hypothetical protein HIM_06691 [Hirsutella minnesotensis 3608]